MSQYPLLVESLQVYDLAGRAIVKDVSFSVGEGKVLALIGESGSGKTSVALSLLGFARPGMQISSGRILIDGSDILSLKARELRNLRGRQVSNVAQNPTASFSPRMQIGKQISELMRTHGYQKKQTRKLIEDALDSVELPHDPAFLARYPFELSGGQLQRVAIAMAFITRPRVIVMDEPTTGLDVSTQQTILQLIKRLVHTSSACFVYVTHDLAVVNTIADDVAVMFAGEIVEMGNRKEIFRSPKHEYTQMLLRSVPQLPQQDSAELSGATSAEAERVDGTITPTAGEPVGHRSAVAVLEVADLYASHGTLEVVHGISFSLARGQCLALVGGSGSGKTTTGRCVVGLHRGGRGRIAFEGRPLPWLAAERSRKDLEAMQIVFQNPDRSLNPRETVGQSIRRALRITGLIDKKVIETEVRRILERVRLPGRMVNLYPEDLSGGERQRVAVARALATKPRLLVCDEITSALDVSVQAAVIDLLLDLKKDGLAMLFITHNLPLVSEIAETVAIMKGGRIVEIDQTADVLKSPQNEYTKSLLAAAPRLDRGDRAFEKKYISARFAERM